MKKRKLLPAFLMLFAGAVVSIAMFFMEYHIKTKLGILLIVFIVFFIIGKLMQKMLDFFDKKNEKPEEEDEEADEGEVIKKEVLPNEKDD